MRPETRLSGGGGGEMTPTAPEPAAAFARAVDLHRASIRQRHEAGLLFAAAKAAAPHGTWLIWLADAGLSRSTVCLYVRVAAAMSPEKVEALGGFVAADAHLAAERAQGKAEAAAEAAGQDGKCANARTSEEASAEPAEAGPAEPELPLSEGDGEADDGVGPLLAEGYDHGKPHHRMVYALTMPGLKGLEPNVLALHSFRDGGGGSFLTHPVIAHYLQCSEDRVRQCYRRLRALGHLRSRLHRNQPITYVFPDGPSEERQRELTLLRTFEGGKQAHPRGEAGSPRGVSPDPARGEAGSPHNRTETGQRTGHRGGRRMSAAEIREAEIDEAIERALRDSA